MFDVLSKVAEIVMGLGVLPGILAALWKTSSRMETLNHLIRNEKVITDLVEIFPRLEALILQFEQYNLSTIRQKIDDLETKISKLANLEQRMEDLHQVNHREGEMLRAILERLPISGEKP